MQNITKKKAEKVTLILYYKIQEFSRISDSQVLQLITQLKVIT